MGRLRSAALALACWLPAACTLTPLPAESSALACTDSNDDDGDGKIDCVDPDCWGFAHCRKLEDGGMPIVEPPVIDPPPVPPVMQMDADTPVATPDADVVVVPDAAVDAEVDAAPPLLCDDSCPPGKCIDGVCSVPPLFGEFKIESLKVVAPRTNDDENNTCFDPAPYCLFVNGLCCDPDPYVVIHVDSVKAGFVTATDDAYPEWDASELAFTLELHEGAEIWLDVVDADSPEVNDPVEAPSNQSIFSCGITATVEAVASGLLTCRPEGYPPFPDFRVELQIQQIDAPGEGDVGDVP